MSQINLAEDEPTQRLSVKYVPKLTMPESNHGPLVWLFIKSSMIFNNLDVTQDPHYFGVSSMAPT